MKLSVTTQINQQGISSDFTPILQNYYWCQAFVSVKRFSFHVIVQPQNVLFQIAFKYLTQIRLHRIRLNFTVIAQNEYEYNKMQFSI